MCLLGIIKLILAYAKCLRYGGDYVYKQADSSTLKYAVLLQL